MENRLPFELKAKLKMNAIKWALDNPDTYEYPDGTYDEKEFAKNMKLYLLMALGEEVIGTVINQGASNLYWRIDFDTPLGSIWHYYEYPRQFELVK